MCKICNSKTACNVCDDCKKLEDTVNILMNKDLHLALKYLMKKFMDTRKSLLTKEQLKKSYWESWWDDHKD